MIGRWNVIVGSALALLVGSGLATAQNKPKPPKKDPPKQEKPTKPDPSKAAPEKPAEKPVMPSFGNEKCPVDGKAASTDMWVDCDGQRVYVCSDACKDAVKKDMKGMLAKAYATVTDVTTKSCIGCSKAVDAAKAVEVVFQGKRLKVCSDACAAAFKKDPYTFLAGVQASDAKDAKNTTDPIDDKPIDPAILAIYKKHIIHFSSAKTRDAFAKDPEKSMTKLKLS